MDDEPDRGGDAGAPAGLTDRLARDGEAGRGDMLGGLGAGAGDRLGPDAAPEEDRPGPNQHSFAGEEPATDAARNYHGRDDPA
jgi:hypothetical protein